MMAELNSNDCEPSVGNGAELPMPETLETKEEKHRRWAMLVLAYSVQFFVIIQSTMYLSALWPYLTKIDPTADETFFGIIMAGFSISGAISNPLLGYLSNKARQTKIPLLIGISATFAGNVGTALAGNFASGKAKWALLCFQLLTGVGAGSLGILSSVVAMCTTLKERDIAVAFRSGIFSGSYLIGPGFASIFSVIGYPGVSVGALKVDMYTTPAIFGAFTMLIAFFVLLVFYKEHWISVHPSEIAKVDSEPSLLQSYDLLPVIVLISIRFTLRFTMSYDQSIGSPFTIAMFNWTNQEAIRYNGIIEASGGVLDLFGNLFVGIVVLKYIRYRYLLPVGLLLFLLFFVFAFSYPHLPDLGINFFCPFQWCKYTTRIDLWQYVMAYVCVFGGSCFAFSPVNSLYSKLFGPRKQFVFQGLFMGAGNLGSALGPIIVSILYQHLGPRVTWAVGACVIFLTLTFVMASFNRLITFDERLEKLGLSLMRNEDVMDVRF